MRIFILSAIVLALFAACNQSSPREELLARNVDSLQQQLKNVYRPGLGEFMLGIQMHHAKLWFAGKAQNWELANFEMEEIEETLGDVKQYCTDRPAVKSIDMINPAVEGLKQAIQAKDEAKFASGFTLLTNTCNTCHVATQHGFNVIRIPDVPPVSNQQFSLK